MKKRTKVILLIVWMIVIFIFSQQPAQISDKNNEFVIYVFNLLGINLNSVFGTLANFIVRKAAHFTEYFILYLLFLNVFRDRYSFFKALFISLIAVFLYACSDEFHQIFIPGRTARFRDVLIDTSGGTLAMIISYFFGTSSKKRKLK